LWSVETLDLQGILVVIDRYLQRLGNIDPDWDRSCSITRREVSAVLQEERRHKQSKQPSTFILKGTLNSSH
jgi:hypothetical protein